MPSTFLRMLSCSLWETSGLFSDSGVAWTATSGEIVASGVPAHCGGIKAGTIGIGVAVAVRVGIEVAVGSAVAVGGTIICVTVLHESNVRIKNPKTIFFFMVYL